MAERARQFGDAERGVSEVLGYALIFGLILVSITAVSVGGIDSLRTVRDAEQLGNAERAFEVLADNTADIYAQDAPSRATEFSIGEATLFTGTNTTVTITDPVDGTPTREFVITPLVFRSGNDNEIVYEGGAIFRTRRDAGRIVREPPQTWSGEEPIVVIVGTYADRTESVAGTDVLARMKARSRYVAIDRNDDFADARIEVESERAGLWQRFLADQAVVESCSLDSTTSPPTVTCDVDTDSDATGTPPEARDLLVVVHEIEMTLEQ